MSAAAAGLNPFAKTRSEPGVAFFRVPVCQSPESSIPECHLISGPCYRGFAYEGRRRAR